MAEANISITFEWTDFNVDETAYVVYRSESEIDIDALPPVHATLEANSDRFVDSGLTEGNTYYYVFGAVRGDEQVLTKNYKVIAGDYIYSFSTTGDMVILDTEGNRIYRNSVANLFGSPISTHTYSSYQNWNITMDMEGSLYAVNNNYELKKLSPNLREAWSVDLKQHGLTAVSYGIALEATIFGTIALCAPVNNIFQLYDAATGAIIYDNRTFNIGTSRSYGHHIVPTVDENIFFIVVGFYNTSVDAFRIDTSKGENTMPINCFKHTGNGYITYARGFSDTNVMTYLPTPGSIYTLDYTGNILRNSPINRNVFDTSNINDSEFYVLQSGGTRVMRYNKDTMENDTMNFVSPFSSSTKTIETIDQSRFVLFGSNGVSMCDWDTQEVLWEYTETITTQHYGFVSNGRQLRTINFDAIPKPITPPEGG